MANPNPNPQSRFQKGHKVAGRKPGQPNLVPPASAGMEVQRMTTNMPTIALWRPPSPRRLGHDEVSRDGGELCSGASYGVSFAFGKLAERIDLIAFVETGRRCRRGRPPSWRELHRGRRCSALCRSLRRCRSRTLSSSHFENLIWPLPISGRRRADRAGLASLVGCSRSRSGMTVGALRLLSGDLCEEAAELQ